MKNPFDFLFSSVYKYVKEMHVYLNNETVQTQQEDLSSFLQDHALHQITGIAVAVNEEVVPRAQWSTCLLHEKDSIIIITATQGG